MDEKKQGWTAFLLLICVCITLGAVIPIGYSFGVINAPAQFIRLWIFESAQSRYSTVLGDSQLTTLMACVASMFQVGGIVGSLVAPGCNTKLGRKGSLLVSGALLTVAAILQLFCRMASSVEMLLLGRLTGGIGAGLVYSTQPMYLVELAPAELSGSVGVFTCIGITGGVVVGQFFSFDFLLGTSKHWHCALGGYVILVIIGLAPLLWFPESPRYLMSKGNRGKTRAILVRLRKSEQRVDTELAEIEAALAVAVEKSSMADVIRNSKLTMPLIIVCSFHLVQQMSGINAIWFYSVSIFTDAGFTLEVALWLNFAEGVLNFFVALFGPWMMASFNRRIMMMLSCLLSSIFLSLLSVGLELMSSYQKVSYGCILFLSLYIVAFNLGLGPMPFFIGSEIFEVSPRPAAMALGSLTNWLSNFLLGMVFPLLQSGIGPFAFIPCSLICLYGFLLTCRYLPETRNRNPKDVAPLLQRGLKSKIK
ncbi:solute carrier family 2, facilitated glucose transporter member 3 isoform X1 [Drosophila pseudoobscura]|uniref:Solute carrier family 2, facilitated glucose transporter member 3 isoform X1 n=1 Tax=Drosophila pseudoobscura pseudoobscura TaxID=46245 RepID=A0A6I8VUA0_DROPS|nr:solute carrier family 2, facilitated glucose transporter member 3 isoform X1 [Drosophila pseudoobscura]XP_033234646.1 solute carrier family 2, facilitated glucose transporter member 3 isoform X1 [Drosophila pseudoobscura]